MTLITTSTSDPHGGSLYGCRAALSGTGMLFYQITRARSYNHKVVNDRLFSIMRGKSCWLKRRSGAREKAIARATGDPSTARPSGRCSRGHSPRALTFALGLRQFWPDTSGGNQQRSRRFRCGRCPKAGFRRVVHSSPRHSSLRKSDHLAQVNVPSGGGETRGGIGSPGRKSKIAVT